VQTEEVDVVMWTFELPHGPQEFMIVESKGDFVKESKECFTYRCRINNGQHMEGNIYKHALYMDRHVATKMNVRVEADPHIPFKPTKK
jgi:hypothetical protein